MKKIIVDVNYIKLRFPINELYEVGFLKSKTDFKDIEKRICTYFGFKDIHEYDKGLAELGLIDKPVLINHGDINHLGDEWSRKN